MYLVNWSGNKLIQRSTFFFLALLSSLVYSSESISPSYYSPQKLIGQSIAKWVDHFGLQESYRATESGINRHTGEPSILLTLNYSSFKVSFIVSPIQGTSTLVELLVFEPRKWNETAVPPLTLGMQFLKGLGKPTTSTATKNTYQQCGDSTCAKIEVGMSNGLVQEVRWSWQLD